MTAAETWDAMAEQLRADLPEPTFNLWFGPVEPVELDDSGFLVLSVPREIYTWVARRYGHRLKALATTSGAAGVDLLERTTEGSTH